MALNSKQRMFVNEYLKCYNATLAAKRSGYTGDDNTLGVTGYNLLRNPKIKEAISQRLSETAMSPDEVVKRLGDIARGSIAPFITLREGDENITLDLTTPQAQANLHLIKKITQRRIIRTKGDDEEIDDTTLSIEMYPADGALNTLAKHHGLLTDYTGRNGEKDKLQIEHGGAVKHSIDENQAVTIFDILASVGAVKSDVGDTTDDEVHSASTDS